MCSQRRFGRCRNTDTRISTVMRFLSTIQQVLLTGLFIVKKDETVLCERKSRLKVYPCSVYALIDKFTERINFDPRTLSKSTHRQTRKEDTSIN